MRKQLCCAVEFAAVASVAIGQVTVTQVDRSVGATVCVFAPPDYPNWCESDGRSNSVGGYWIDSVVFGNSAAGAVGFGSSIAVCGQESTIGSDKFTIVANARVELQSAGECSATALALSSFEVRFTALSAVRAELNGYTNVLAGGELRISLRHAGGTLIYTWNGTFNAAFDLAAGDYIYFASGISEGSCAGGCADQENVNWSSEITFSPLECPADLNGDEMVEDADFVIFVAAYNELICPELPAECPADFNRDGLVDDADFVFFVGAYNDLVCP